MRLNEEGERAPGRRRILLKGEHGRDAQPSSITGKESKVDAGMYFLIPLAGTTAGKLRSQ
jgi:hypothetical protein